MTISLQSSISSKLTTFVEKIEAAFKALDQGVSAATLAAHERLFIRGVRSDGHAIGNYSAAYVKKREKAGLGSSDQVVLTFTGELSAAWGYEKTQDAYLIGFQSDESEKVNNLTSKYGEDLFALSQAEKDLILNSIQF